MITSVLPAAELFLDGAEPMRQSAQAVFFGIALGAHWVTLIVWIGHPLLRGAWRYRWARRGLVVGALGLTLVGVLAWFNGEWLLSIPVSGVFIAADCLLVAGGIRSVSARARSQGGLPPDVDEVAAILYARDARRQGAGAVPWSRADDEEVHAYHRSADFFLARWDSEVDW